VNGDSVRLLTEWILGFAVNGTVVLGTLALLSRWGRPASPALRDLAWKAGVVAVAVSSAVGVFGAGDTAPGSPPGGAVLERTVLMTRAGESTVRASERITVPGLARRSEACADLTGRPAVPSPERARSIREACGGPLDAVPGVLVALWGAGALLGLLGLARDALALRREVARSGPADPATDRLLDDLRVRAGVGDAVRVVVLPGLASPAALGSRLIGLPPEAQDEMTPLELEAVLAHELAHLRRGDPYWVTVLAAVDALCWFQPLVGRARREIRDAGEVLADDRAVSWTGRPLELARSLARAAEWLTPGRRLPALAVVRPGAGVLAGRVARLVDARSGTARIHWLVAPALVAFLVALQGALPAIRVPPPVDVDVSVTLASAPAPRLP
jgi:beta-lactamase regulating signal transducer with metallopeptidase domain